MEIELTTESDKSLVESAFQLQKNRFERMLNVSRTCTWDRDIKNDCIISELNMKNIFGFIPNTRDDFFNNIYPADIIRVKAAIEAAIKNTNSFHFHFRFLRPDNHEVRWLETTGEVSFSPERNSFVIYGTTADITDKKIADEELDATRKQFRILTNTLPNIIWKADKNGCISFFNESWYQFTNATEDTTLGMNWLNYLHPNDRAVFTDQWENIRKTSSSNCVIELRLMDKNNNYKWFLWQAKPVTSSSGNVIKWFGSLTEIDKQKIQLEAAQIDLKTKDQFLEIAAHELKTPFTALKINLEIAREILNNMNTTEQSSTSERKLQKAINITHKHANQITLLIENLFSLSSIKNEKINLYQTTVVISDLLTEFVNKYRDTMAQSGCKIFLHVNTRAQCKLDAVKIEQAIVNILNNARKYAPNSPIYIELTEIRNTIQISIKDEGPGIKKDLQKNLFDPYFRNTQQKNISGLGLGLYISKQIVDAHKGRISLESEPGHGAKFTIELPIATN